MTNDDDLVSRLLAYVKAGPAWHLKTAPPQPDSLASAEDLADAEARLGFELPELLRRCYREIGNGGFGPGWGLIGLRGGCKSSHGDIVESRDVLQEGVLYSKGKWPARLLPICDWGCAIFTCVMCDDTTDVYTCDNGKVSVQGYDLAFLFELWMSGRDILDYDPRFE